MNGHRHTMEHIKVDDKELAKSVGLLEELSEGHEPVIYVTQTERELIKFAYSILYDIRKNIVVYDGAVITREE